MAENFGVDLDSLLDDFEEREEKRKENVTNTQLVDDNKQISYENNLDQHHNILNPFNSTITPPNTADLSHHSSQQPSSENYANFLSNYHHTYDNYHTNNKYTNEDFINNNFLNESLNLNNNSINLHENHIVHNDNQIKNNAGSPYITNSTQHQCNISTNVAFNKQQSHIMNSSNAANDLTNHNQENIASITHNERTTTIEHNAKSIESKSIVLAYDDNGTNNESIINTDNNDECSKDDDTKHINNTIKSHNCTHGTNKIIENQTNNETTKDDEKMNQATKHIIDLTTTDNKNDDDDKFKSIDTNKSGYIDNTKSDTDLDTLTDDTHDADKEIKNGYEATAHDVDENDGGIVDNGGDEKFKSEMEVDNGDHNKNDGDICCEDSVDDTTKANGSVDQNDNEMNLSNEYKQDDVSTKDSTHEYKQCGDDDDFLNTESSKDKENKPNNDNNNEAGVDDNNIDKNENDKVSVDGILDYFNNIESKIQQHVASIEGGMMVGREEDAISGDFHHSIHYCDAEKVIENGVQVEEETSNGYEDALPHGNKSKMEENDVLNNKNLSISNAIRSGLHSIQSNGDKIEVSFKKEQENERDGGDNEILKHKHLENNDCQKNLQEKIMENLNEKSQKLPKDINGYDGDNNGGDVGVCHNAELHQIANLSPFSSRTASLITLSPASSSVHPSSLSSQPSSFSDTTPQPSSSYQNVPSLPPKIPKQSTNLNKPPIQPPQEHHITHSSPQQQQPQNPPQQQQPPLPLSNVDSAFFLTQKVQPHQATTQKKPPTTINSNLPPTIQHYPTSIQNSLLNNQQIISTETTKITPSQQPTAHPQTLTHPQPTTKPQLQPLNLPLASQPLRCTNIDLPLTCLGKVKPTWMGDEETKHCLSCQSAFTLLRRKHHCRACGLIFCAACCSSRHPIKFMNDSIERVCSQCFVDFNRVSSLRPDPNNPSQYCSTIPPSLQSPPATPLLSVLVPTGVPKKNGTRKKVMFSDGIKPGGDLAHLDGHEDRAGRKFRSLLKKQHQQPTSSSFFVSQHLAYEPPPPLYQPVDTSSSSSASQISSSSSPVSYTSSSSLPASHTSSSSAAASQKPSSLSLPTKPLPNQPLLTCDQNGVFMLTSTPMKEIIQKLDKGEALRLYINERLTLHLQIISKVCCIRKKVLYVSSVGLLSLCACEVAFLIKINTHDDDNNDDGANSENNIDNNGDIDEASNTENSLKDEEKNDNNINNNIKKNNDNITYKDDNNNNELWLSLEGGALLYDIINTTSSIYHASINGERLQEMDVVNIPEYNNNKNNKNNKNNINVEWKVNRAFLAVRSTQQCVSNLPRTHSPNSSNNSSNSSSMHSPQNACMHSPPRLFLLLILQAEVTWARCLPLRLLLRLGAQFRYYPCPLYSTLHRKPVFSGIGHTIMNLLIDFNTFQYSIFHVPDLLIHVTGNHTSVIIPTSAKKQVHRWLSQSDGHILAVRGSVSEEADCHLVSVEGRDGKHTTQAINIHGKPRKVTGATFIVFNGALKVKVKTSVVEDGLMVALDEESMKKLKEALHEGKDLSFQCDSERQLPSPQQKSRQHGNQPTQGSCGQEAANEASVVNIKWVNNLREKSNDLKSPINGKNLSLVGREIKRAVILEEEGLKKNKGGKEKRRKNDKTGCEDTSRGDGGVEWGVFLSLVSCFILGDETTPDNVFVPLCRQVCNTFVQCFTPFARTLFSSPSSLSSSSNSFWSIKIDLSQISYEVGTPKQPPPSCFSSLDSSLIPLLHQSPSTSPSIELLFALEETFK